MDGMAKRPGRQGSVWRRAKAGVEGNDCWFCHLPIPTWDELRVGRYVTHPWNHPDARTIHHIVSVAECVREHEQPCPHLTDADNLVPAHRHCNSSDGQHPALAVVGSDGTCSRIW